MTSIPWINHDEALPSPRLTLDPDPDFPGLMAFSDDLNVKRLIEAYRQGMFPWYSADEPIMWWCTHPRMVLPSSNFKVSHSLKKKISQVMEDDAWEIRVDHAFFETILACSEKPRPGQNGTWITDAIIHAYYQLHEQGFAHSIETWHQGTLVGGLYCVSFGKMVFGESMFAHETDASKLALAALCGWCNLVGIELIDCQQETKHLASLGAAPIPRENFLEWVEQHVDLPHPEWKFGKNTLKYWL
jgi:leucyl/phenylalanyl-tRNA--protein transferase